MHPEPVPTLSGELLDDVSIYGAAWITEEQLSTLVSEIRRLRSTLEDLITARNAATARADWFALALTAIRDGGNTRAWCTQTATEALDSQRAGDRSAVIELLDRNFTAYHAPTGSHLRNLVDQRRMGAMEAVAALTGLDFDSLWELFSARLDARLDAQPAPTDA